MRPLLLEGSMVKAAWSASVQMHVVLALSTLAPFFSISAFLIVFLMTRAKRDMRYSERDVDFRRCLGELS